MIPSEPPWIIEIDGVRYVAPEAVCLLLKSVSEERDILEDAVLDCSSSIYDRGEMQAIAGDALDKVNKKD